MHFAGHHWILCKSIYSPIIDLILATYVTWRNILSSIMLFGSYTLKLNYHTGYLLLDWKTRPNRKLFWELIWALNLYWVRPFLEMDCLYTRIPGVSYNITLFIIYTRIRHARTDKQIGRYEDVMFLLGRTNLALNMIFLKLLEIHSEVQV